MAEILHAHPFERPEYVREPEAADPGWTSPRQRGLAARFAGIPAVRQATLLVLVGLAWQGYAMLLDNSLMLPTAAQALEAFARGIADGVLIERGWTSVKVLLGGYVVGFVAALILTGLAVATRIGSDLLTLLTAMFNPLPAIALLPLALLWFGLGTGSLTFVLVHAVLWPIALNTHAGFLGVSPTLRMAGASFGLRGAGLVFRLLIPAAFPAILTGLKVGWAFAWRTLIAAELVFGVSAGSGGLGWYIFENRNQLETANVFAGLLAVIVIGLAVEGVIFRSVERLTVRRWGMQQQWRAE